jgi:hypothetical protein
MNEIPSLPIFKFQQAFQWIFNPLEYLHKHERECGDVFTDNVSSSLTSVVLFSNPHSIQKILTSDTKLNKWVLAQAYPMVFARSSISVQHIEQRNHRYRLCPDYHCPDTDQLPRSCMYHHR